MSDQNGVQMCKNLLAVVEKKRKKDRTVESIDWNCKFLVIKILYN